MARKIIDRPISTRIEQLMQDNVIKGCHHTPPTTAELTGRFRGMTQSDLYPLAMDEFLDIAREQSKQWEQAQEMSTSAVNTPNHYAVNGMFELVDLLAAHPTLSGFRMQAIQYVYRADLKSKGDKAKEIEDLEKAVKFLTFEIRRLRDEPVSDTLRKYLNVFQKEQE